MAFIVTARKWRPKKFSEVVGQDHITTTLKNAIKNNRIAHAYLFTGPRGVGKTTTARLMAKVLNCLNPLDFEPCNECEMCRSITENQSLDIIEIDGASNRGIDEIRTLRDSVKYAPARGKYKVYIIDEVHMLTRESFNAFLKTLEEPPAHTIFIFATTDIHKVPLTIISRCQRYDFRRIQLDTIKTLLAKIAEEEGIEIDDKTLTIIGKKADGALRDAESFFDQVVSFCGTKIDSGTVSMMLNLIDDEIYFNISDAVISKNYNTVFDVSTQLYKNGWNFVDFTNGLIEHFRNIMTVVVTGHANLIESADVFKSKYLEYAGQFSEADLLRILNFLNRTQQELRFAQNQKIKIEVALSHLIGLERSATITGILQRIESSDFGRINRNYDTDSGEPEKKNFSREKPADFSAPAAEEIKPVYTPPGTAKEPGGDSADFSFSTVIDKWQEFIDSVCAERSLMLGSFIKTVTPESLEGQKFIISSSEEHASVVFKQNSDYLHQKFHSFYGKKISVVLNLSKPAETAKPAPGAPLWEDDDVINAVKTELGGVEIT